MRSGTTTLLQHMNAINVNVRWEKMAQSSNQNARRPIASGSNRGLSLCKHFCSASEFEATRANGGQTSALRLVGYIQEFSLYFGTRHACWLASNGSWGIAVLSEKLKNVVKNSDAAAAHECNQRKCALGKNGSKLKSERTSANFFWVKPGAVTL